MKKTKLRVISGFPGRVRLESAILKNNPLRCRSLEKRLLIIKGIKEVAINYRTGRVLIHYSQSDINFPKLPGIYEFSINGNSIETRFHSHEGDNRLQSFAVFVADTAFDIVSDILLPKPFGFFVPIAVKAISA